MELTMTNNFGFCELNENEMMMVDGGRDYWGVVGGVCLTVAAVGLSIMCPYAAPAMIVPAEQGIAWASTSWNS